MIFLNPTIAGIVLAGGQSRRMGFNKAEALVHGRSMLLHMIDKLSAITPVILVSSGNLTYPDIEYPQIPDEYPDCGPLGGIYSVLKASITDLNLVVSCDIPLVTVEILNYIVEKAEESKALITAPMDENGQLHLLCGVYHKNILPFMERQLKLNALKLKNLSALTSIEIVEISEEHPLYDKHAFKNVNTPDVLNETRELWKNP